MVRGVSSLWQGYGQRESESLFLAPHPAVNPGSWKGGPWARVEGSRARLVAGGGGVPNTQADSWEERWS